MIEYVLLGFGIAGWVVCAVVILGCTRKRQAHRSINKQQGPDEYMRAECTCGAKFKALDGRFGLYDFQRWEKEHRRGNT